MLIKCLMSDHGLIMGALPTLRRRRKVGDGAAVAAVVDLIDARDITNEYIIAIIVSIHSNM